MADNTARQAIVQSALDKLPQAAMRARTLHHLLSGDGDTRVFLDPATGAFHAFAGNAERPADAGILLTVDDIPVSLRPPAVPDTPAELIGDV